MTELERIKVALMAIWEILGEDPVIDELPSRERKLLKRIEEEVINPIYLDEDIDSLSLVLDDFMEGGTL